MRLPKKGTYNKKEKGNTLTHEGDKDEEQLQRLRRKATEIQKSFFTTTILTPQDKPQDCEINSRKNFRKL